MFALDYFKQLHTEHVKHALCTSHYVPNSPTRKDGKLLQFCPPSQVKEQLKLLLSLLKQYQNEHVDPVALAAWFHAEFIRIHPFVDGNGRIGRLLSSQILMKYDLLPMIVERKKRSECMNESITQNNLTSLMHFIKREQLVLIEQVRKQTICEKQKYPLCQIDDYIFSHDSFLSNTLLLLQLFSLLLLLMYYFFLPQDFLFSCFGQITRIFSLHTANEL